MTWHNNGFAFWDMPLLVTGYSYPWLILTYCLPQNTWGKFHLQLICWRWVGENVSDNQKLKYTVSVLQRMSVYFPFQRHTHDLNIQTKVNQPSVTCKSHDDFSCVPKHKRSTLFVIVLFQKQKNVNACIHCRTGFFVGKTLLLFVAPLFWRRKKFCGCYRDGNVF